MRWVKHGRIFAPDPTVPWMETRALPPTPYLRPDGVLRIYVGMTDAATVSRLGYVDVDPGDPGTVLGVSPEPLLDVGAPGTFDENGLVPLSIVEVDDRLFLYYVGYQLGMKVRHYQFTGLAVSTDGGESFERVSQVPILDRTDEELLNRNSSFVLLEDGRFRMWYAAGSEWTEVDGRPMPVYDLRYLESDDGVHWPPEGRPCFPVEHERGEYAHGKPWIFETGERYEMYYSVRLRGIGYRLGYAESPDGLEWTRKDDEIGIDVSADGWDSEMMGYPAVIKHNETKLLFYNGNGLGSSGFGYAVEE
jgi:predicted GH43/DUF377 family glycosyl hydrolase